MPVVSSCSSARAMKRREFIMLLGGVESRMRRPPHEARNAGPLIRTSRSGRRRRHRDENGLRRQIARYVVLPAHADIALALWLFVGKPEPQEDGTAKGEYAPPDKLFSKTI